MSETLKMYHIQWEIDVEARSHEEAAKLALDIQMDRKTVATIFVVNGQHVVDMEDYKTNKAGRLDDGIETRIPIGLLH